MGKKYTKGPWFTEPDDDSEHHVIYSDYGLQWHVAYTPPFSLNNKQATANAYLIAAAPELLEALEKIVEMNRQHALDQYGDADKAESWSCVTVARQAINKALNIQS